MRILYINKTVSGPMEPLARFIAQKRARSSVFMAERWPRETQLPGGMLVRIPTVVMPDCAPQRRQTWEQAIEKLAQRNARNAANVKNACLRLRQSGFVPDVVYATSQDGYALDVQSVFPKARVAARLDGLYPSKAEFRGDVTQTRIAAYEHMHKAFQYPLLAQCAVGITASNWQKKLFPEDVEKKIRVIANGVDTQFFAPSPGTGREEIVTFACQGANPARGIHTICQCLPGLLTLRPQCRVYLVSFASRRSDAARAQHVKELSALLPHLNEQQRQRIAIVASPAPAAYLALLQQTTLYVYLTTPGLLSAGLMEAMSCGALVLASATGAVREVITHGENGILWEDDEAQALTFAVAHACANADALDHLRRNARATILEKHDMRRLLPEHATAVLGA